MVRADWRVIISTVRKRKSNCEFSDTEVHDIALVAEDWFVQATQWTVTNVGRRPGRRDLVDVTIDSLVGDERTLIIEVPCQEFQSDAEGLNTSPLSDAVFNFSIRLMEFQGIRGFDQFADGETVSLVIYPEP
jgi:hypothetical protein